MHLLSLMVAACLALGDSPAPRPEVAECLARVKAIHGGAGPWAVVGYRIGERARTELNLPRQSFAIKVVHSTPGEVQYACMADGLQAATGASVGKLNLRLEEVPVDKLRTTIVGLDRTLVFRVRPELARTILDLPIDRLEAEGRRVAELPDEALFTMEEIKAPAPASPESGRKGDGR